MINVVSIIRKQSIGSTDPYIAILDDDGEALEAFIKFKGNPQGCLCLINELISYRLAKLLGVLMPLSGVANINDITIDNSYSYEINLQHEKGSCFYSKRIEKGVPLNRQAMKFVSNKDIYEKIILFDHLIYNKDRNDGNILLSGKKSEKIIYAIDHTHVFKNESIWNGVALRQGILANDFEDTVILENNTIYDLFFDDKNITRASLREVAINFQQIINSKVLDEVLKDLPKDWLIEKDDLIALRDYLLYRSSHLLDMCEMIVKEKGLENGKC